MSSVEDHPGRSAFSIDEFCERNGISRPTYYRLKKAGRAPAEMRVGTFIVRVSIEAELAWQRSMAEPNARAEAMTLARGRRAAASRKK